MPSLYIAAQLIRRTMGSRRGLIMNVLLPAIVLSIVVGLFADSHNQKAVIAVNNSDEGILGSYLVESLNKESLYEVRLESSASDEIVRSAVEYGKADAGLYIPPDFTQALLEEKQPEVDMYRMSEQLWNASLATLLDSELSKLTATVLLVRGEGDNELVMNQLIALLDRQAQPKLTTEQVSVKLGNIVSNPLMIGLILMFIMMLAIQTIGFVMEDREHRTMARMYTAPVRAHEIAFGNFIGSILVGTIQLVIILGSTYFVFGYSPGISFGAMLLVLECFLFAAVGIASAVAGFVRISAQLSQLNNLIIMPTCLISGCFFPLSMLPEFMQKLANFTPQKWAIQAIDRLVGGGTLGDIGNHLLILLLIASVMMTFGAAVLRPNRTS
ncbi:ABC transporter permease [Paenibacillus sp. sgz302251]|uniref:ABC transporter permease n=1 Tax=Paenibacillus sp. sgz302251 TaxID=3414493 RepID=UPI003C7CCC66